MLKEALSMILGPRLIFCINYTQRKLKRCFSRAQHFYAYTPLAKSVWKSWTAHCNVLCFSAVWCWGGERLLGVCKSIAKKTPKRRREDRWGVTRCRLWPLSDILAASKKVYSCAWTEMMGKKRLWEHCLVMQRWFALNALELPYKLFFLYSLLTLLIFFCHFECLASKKRHNIMFENIILKNHKMKGRE